jgi:hypothetical protein
MAISILAETWIAQPSVEEGVEERVGLLDSPVGRRPPPGVLKPIFPSKINHQHQHNSSIIEKQSLFPEDTTHDPA